MKNSRLFEILYLLVEKRSLTAGELAKRLEVSERTIYRDIDALSAAGIPVFTQKGQGGGIRLMEQFVLDRTLLSPQQQDEILLSLRAMLSTAPVGGEETLSRLAGLFGRQAGEWLEVDFSDWGSGERQRQLFRLVKESILRREALSFTYYAADGSTARRTAEPERLVFKGQGWYLLAFCRLRQDWRFFRLSRMEDPVPAGGPCPHRPSPPPPEIESSEGCPMTALRLRFQPQAAYRVWDEFGPSQITPLPGGGLEVAAVFPDTPWVLGFLLSFGALVEVLEPERWRMELAQAAKNLLRLYET